MIKTRGAAGRAVVMFTLDEQVGARHAAICGDWNGWSADRDVMVHDDNGFHLSLVLEAGRSYRFRYLLDGERWENDWAADAYVANDYGGDDSLVDLTAGRGGARGDGRTGEEGRRGEEGASRQEGRGGQEGSGREDGPGEGSRPEGGEEAAGMSDGRCPKAPAGQRRGRDLNPRIPFEDQLISSESDSAALAPLQTPSIGDSRGSRALPSTPQNPW